MTLFKVGIAGATGAVGQRFIDLLMGERTPTMFVVVALGASDKNVGKTYEDAAHWVVDTPMPDAAKSMTLGPCTAAHFQSCQIVFSGLDSSVAGQVELDLARAGIVVCSNAKNYRMHDDVPILLPLVNPEHIAIVATQRRLRGWTSGAIITNANCSATGLATILKPLQVFGIETVHVVTMQAVSGAGYPGVASLDIMGNVIPFIDEEEKKLETETLKILGHYDAQSGSIQAAEFGVAAACNRVPVLNGHTGTQQRAPCAHDVVVTPVCCQSVSL
jgi:aspartate-semialdehyde dehydrogenase